MIYLHCNYHDLYKDCECKSTTIIRNSTLKYNCFLFFVFIAFVFGVFDYYGEEIESCSFYRIPQQLIVGDRFSGLSMDAKLLYGYWKSRTPAKASASSKKQNRDKADRRIYVKRYTTREIHMPPTVPPDFSNEEVQTSKKGRRIIKI